MYHIGGNPLQDRLKALKALSDSLVAALPKEKLNSLGYLFFLEQDSLIVGSGELSRGGEGWVGMWSQHDGKLDTTVSMHEYESVWRLSVSNFEDFIGVTTSNADEDSNFLGCYSVRGKRWLWKLQNLDNFEEVQFVDNDKELLAIGEHKIYWVDPKTGRILDQHRSLLQEYHSPGSRPEGGHLSPSGRYYTFWQESFPGSGIENDRGPHKNKDIDVWDVRNGEKVATIEAGDSCYNAGVYMADERHMLLGCIDGTLRIWSSTENIFARGWKADSEFLDYLIISRDGRYVAAYGDFSVTILKYPSFEKVRYFKDVANNSTSGGPYPMAFSADGKHFAMENQGFLYLYDTTTWQELWHVDTAR